MACDENASTDTTWWRAEGPLAIRESADSTAERIADFRQNDIVKGFGMPTNEWLCVSLEGANRFEDGNDGEDNNTSGESVDSGKKSEMYGFVRIKNKFRELLTQVGDTVAVTDQWAQQTKDRAKCHEWFRPPPSSQRIQAMYDKPLLVGGIEEFERRWELQAVVTEIIAAQPNLRNYGPNQLKVDLRNRFPDADWLESLLGQKTVVASLLSTAVTELSPDQGAYVGPGMPDRTVTAVEAALQQSAVACAPAPLREASSTARSSWESTRQEKKVTVTEKESGYSSNADVSLPKVALPGSQTLSPLGPPAAATLPASLLALLADAGGATELLGRLPWVDYRAFASVARITALAVRNANWQRLAEVLAGEYGLLVPRLQPGHAAAPASAEEWRGLFNILWEARQKWRGGSRGQDLQIQTCVRIRPGAVDNASESSSKLFLPLHQRLQLVKLGHDPSFKEEVAQRMTKAQGDVEGEHVDNLDVDKAEVSVNGKASLSARIISTEEKRVLANLPGMGLRYFDFQRVFDGRHGQIDVYRDAGLPAVEAFLSGLSACLFCYGQTGSGKTYTVFGAEGALGTAAAEAESLNSLGSQAGLAPRVLSDVMAATGRVDSVSSTITLSYVEIYNDKLTDLLSGRDVTLFRIGQGVGADEYRESVEVENDAAYHLQGADVMEITSSAEAIQALADSEARKHRAATAINVRSSRAHTILMLGLTQRFSGRVLRSRLHLVDLGGSEQVKKSKAEGERFEEAVEINRGLMTLGKVVDALVQGHSHVPYYESRLTMLLQPALGGNTRTTVLVTASPEDKHGDESVHALRFGERCARVTNEACYATASMAEVLASLEANIAACEKEIAALDAQGASAKARAELGDAGLRGLGFGHDHSRLVARSHDDGTSGKEAGLSGVQANAQRSNYTMVEDLAGRWIAERERLQALRQRQSEILGH